MTMINKLLLLCGLLTAIMLYPVAFNGYSNLSLFWIVGGCLNLAFWVVAFHPNYYWSDLSLAKKLIAAIVLIQFCISFLPVDILLSDNASRLQKLLNMLLVLGLVWGDRDGGDSTKGKQVKPTRKRRWSFIPQAS